MNCLTLRIVPGTLSDVVRITEQEASAEPLLAVAKAMAARARGAVVECPWWFTFLAMSNPKFYRVDKRAAAMSERLQEGP